MGNACAKCGAENREKAMFCLGCGGKLAAVQALASDEGASPGSAPPTGVALPPEARHAADRAVTRAEGRRAVPLYRRPAVVGLMLVASVWTTWFYLNQQTNQPHPPLPTAAALPGETVQPPSTAPLATLPRSEEPAASAAGAQTSRSAQQPVPDPAAEGAEAERLTALKAQNARLNQQRLERQKRERMLATQEQARELQERERQRAEPASRPAQSAPVAPVAVAPAPAAQPETPALTVTRMCDETGNFFAREVCRVRECRKPSLANDPVCVRFRNMEEANRASELNN